MVASAASIVDLGVGAWAECMHVRAGVRWGGGQGRTDSSCTGSLAKFLAVYL